MDCHACHWYWYLVVTRTYYGPADVTRESELVEIQTHGATKSECTARAFEIEEIVAIKHFLEGPCSPDSS